MASARPCRDNTPLATTRKRAPSNLGTLLVLGNQTKETVRFVGYSGREIHAGAQRKKIPQPIKLERRAIGAHERLDERAGRWIVNVDESITEIADPKFVIHQGESHGALRFPFETS